MKTILKIGLAVIIMGFISNLLFGGGSSHGADLPAMIKDGALVIDARSAGEFAGGHIEGAINMPHNTVADTLPKYESDKSRVIIVYCLSGARSGSAKKALIRAGYTNVTNGGSLNSMRKQLGQ